MLGKQFKASRGLRQGDPLSPFLFLLCTKGLLVTLIQAELHDHSQAIKIRRRSPSISHLLFVDDYYIFSQASMENAATIKDILSKYKKALGQFTNLSKSEIIFYRQTHLVTQQKVASTLNMRVSYNLFGLPSSTGKNKIHLFNYIVEWAHSKINNWKA